MNNTQRVIVAVALILIALFVVFPPVTSGNPRFPLVEAVPNLDVARLVLKSLVVMLVAGALVLLTGRRDD